MMLLNSGVILKKMTALGRGRYGENTRKYNRNCNDQYKTEATGQKLNGKDFAK